MIIKTKDFIAELFLDKYKLKLIKLNYKKDEFFRPTTKPATDNLSIKVTSKGVYIKSFSDKLTGGFFRYDGTEPMRVVGTLERAVNTYKTLSTEWTTDYIKSKKLDSNKANRIHNIKTIKNVLVIPIYKYIALDTERPKEKTLEIINFQFIHKDGFKHFLKFKPKELKESLNHSFTKIQSRTDKLSSATYIVEGVATGISVAQALPEAEIIVAFNDLNAIRVARALKDTKKQGFNKRLIITLGELDKKTGLKHKPYKKEEWRSLIAYPDFKTKNHGLTDWNDLHVSLGIREVREQILNTTFNESIPIPIGHNTVSNTLIYFVFSYRCNSILKLTPELDSIKTSLFSPTLYSKIAYIGGTAKQLYLLHTYLTDICLIRKEIKNNTLISWGLRKYNDMLIFNSGSDLFKLENKKFTKLPYTFELCAHFKNGTVVTPDFEDIKPWKADRVLELTKLLYNYDLEQKNQALLLIGFLAQSIVRGIKSYGGNIHIGGASSSGKSKIKTELVYPLMPKNVNAVHIDGVDTSRQAIQRDLNGFCGLLFYEEGEEKDADVSEQKILQRIMSLVREGTEGTDNCTVKVVNDKPKYFLKCFSFLTFSIMHAVKKQQDLNRFIFFKLIRNKVSKYLATRSKVIKITNNNPLGFTKLALSNAEMYEENFDSLLDYLVKRKPEFNDHKHRNLASNLAGFCMVTDTNIDVFKSEEAISKFDWSYGQYLHTKEDDKVDTVDKFLSLIVPKGLLGNINLTSLGLCIQDYGIYENTTNILKSHKIKYDKDSGKFYFCPKADIFKNILKENNSMLDNIHENLKDHKLVSNARYRINGVQIRGFVIDLNNYKLHKKVEEE